MKMCSSFHKIRARLGYSKDFCKELFSNIDWAAGAIIAVMLVGGLTLYVA